MFLIRNCAGIHLAYWIKIQICIRNMATDYQIALTVQYLYISLIFCFDALNYVSIISLPIVGVPSEDCPLAPQAAHFSPVPPKINLKVTVLKSFLL